MVLEDERALGAVGLVGDQVAVGHRAVDGRVVVDGDAVVQDGDAGRVSTEPSP